jgi:hypothetical protein
MVQTAAPSRWSHDGTMVVLPVTDGPRTQLAGLNKHTCVHWCAGQHALHEFVPPAQLATLISQ